MNQLVDGMVLNNLDLSNITSFSGGGKTTCSAVCQCSSFLNVSVFILFRAIAYDGNL